MISNVSKRKAMNQNKSEVMLYLRRTVCCVCGKVCVGKCACECVRVFVCVGKCVCVWLFV